MYFLITVNIFVNLNYQFPHLALSATFVQAQTEQPMPTEAQEQPQQQGQSQGQPQGQQEQQAPAEPEKRAREAIHEKGTDDILVIDAKNVKGIDYRIREHLVTREISIGDYVLTGGELAACVIADSVVRIIPGAIGDEASALTDCFQDNLLAPPVYTRPAEFNGWKVPEVLLSGNFAEIEKWQEEQAYIRTKELRPDLLDE